MDIVAFNPLFKNETQKESKAKRRDVDALSDKVESHSTYTRSNVRNQVVDSRRFSLNYLLYSFGLLGRPTSCMTLLLQQAKSVNDSIESPGMQYWLPTGGLKRQKSL